jgi:wyosine [tRNA(Phe)-imidazoG37] synthetase (radical SAM superfamily)
MSINVTKYHPRKFREMRYVYPVISRRSGGLSVGINLSPTAVCNFSCVYCQVLSEIGAESSQSDSKLSKSDIDIERLESELIEIAGLERSGELYCGNDWLSCTPIEKRVLRDIAFSGDGEPTLARQFNEIAERIINLRNEYYPPNTKLVVITNGTTLHKKNITESLINIIDNNGEIWAKLDAGTKELFEQVSRSKIDYNTIINNLTNFAKQRQIIIQSCFFAIKNQPVLLSEINQYAEKLLEINSTQKTESDTGNIARVQIYTVARNTPVAWVTSLSDDEVDNIAKIVREKTNLQVDQFYSR